MKATIQALLTRIFLPACAAVTMIGMAPNAEAAAYIKFDGVDGESLDKDHKGWCDLLSFSQAIHKPGTGTGASRRRGDVILEDIVCVKELDKASPKLAESICKGRVFPKVEIHLTKSVTGADGTTSEVTYLKYELTNVMITSYDVNASGDETVPPVTRSALNFEEIKVTYTEMDRESGRPKGNIEYSWKVEEGEA